MKRIVVATDFSSIADQAFLYSAHLAAHFGAELHVAHVVSPSPFLAHSPGDLIDQTLKEMTREVELHMTEMQQQLPQSIKGKVDLVYEVREGLVIDQLRDIADDVEADLMVMGTHGKTGWREVLMGTHAAAMVGRLDIPLLLVPPKTDYNGMRHIVYAIDYHDVPDRELQQLQVWTRSFSSRLSLLHVDQEEGEVDEDQLFSLRNTVAALDGVDDVKYAFIEGDDALLSINDWVESHQADLLVVKHRNQNFFQQLVRKSLSRQMTRYTSIPMMVFSQ